MTLDQFLMTSSGVVELHSDSEQALNAMLWAKDRAGEENFEYPPWPDFHELDAGNEHWNWMVQNGRWDAGDDEGGDEGAKEDMDILPVILLEILHYVLELDSRVCDGPKEKKYGTMDCFRKARDRALDRKMREMAASIPNDVYPHDQLRLDSDGELAKLVKHYAAEIEHYGVLDQDWIHDCALRDYYIKLAAKTGEQPDYTLLSDEVWAAAGIFPNAVDGSSNQVPTPPSSSPPPGSVRTPPANSGTPSTTATEESPMVRTPESDRGVQHDLSRLHVSHPLLYDSIPEEPEKEQPGAKVQ